VLWGRGLPTPRGQLSLQRITLRHALLSASKGWNMAGPRRHVTWDQQLADGFVRPSLASGKSLLSQEQFAFQWGGGSTTPPKAGWAA